MFEILKNDWVHGSFFNKAYIVFAILVLALMVAFAVRHLRSNPKKKLNFITEAQKRGCMAVGKMTCLTMHGYGTPDSYQAEYMYVVNGKRYFVTYSMKYFLAIDDRKNETNADMLVLKIKPVIILFYDEKDPSKVMSKLEVFTSHDGIHQVRTPKNNVWRDTEKDWVKAINLVQY